MIQLLLNPLIEFIDLFYLPQNSPGFFFHFRNQVEYLVVLSPAVGVRHNWRSPLISIKTELRTGTILTTWRLIWRHITSVIIWWFVKSLVRRRRSGAWRVAVPVLQMNEGIGGRLLQFLHAFFLILLANREYFRYLLSKII